MCRAVFPLYDIPPQTISLPPLCLPLSSIQKALYRSTGHMYTHIDARFLWISKVDTSVGKKKTRVSTGCGSSSPLRCTKPVRFFYDLNLFRRCVVRMYRSFRASVTRGRNVVTVFDTVFLWMFNWRAISSYGLPTWAISIISNQRSLVTWKISHFVE